MPKNLAHNSKWAMINLEEWMKDYNRRHLVNPCPSDILLASCDKTVLNNDFVCTLLKQGTKRASHTLLKPYTHCFVASLGRIGWRTPSIQTSFKKTIQISNSLPILWTTFLKVFEQMELVLLHPILRKFRRMMRCCSVHLVYLILTVLKVSLELFSFTVVSASVYVEGRSTANLPCHNWNITTILIVISINGFLQK